MIENEFVDAIDTTFRTKTVLPVAVRSNLHARIADACHTDQDISGPCIYWHAWSALEKNFSLEALRISKIEELLDLFWWTQIVLRTILVCAKPIIRGWLNHERGAHRRIYLPSLKRAAELHFLARVLRPHFQLLTVQQPSLLIQSEASVLEKEQCIMLYYVHATAIRHRNNGANPVSVALVERLVPTTTEYSNKYWPAVEEQSARRVRAHVMWRTRRARVLEVCSALAGFCLPNELLVQIVSEVCGFDLDDEFGTRYRIVAAVTLYTRAQTNH